MVNLTSFRLSYIPPGAVPIGQLLDFLESAPHLEEVKLYSATPTTGAKSGRLVSLGCLKSMYIDTDDPASVLLDHLLIPVWAKLRIRVETLSPITIPQVSRYKNFSDFTQSIRSRVLHEFGGPNGEVEMTLRTSRDDLTSLALESLAELDTSKTERLEIDSGDLLSGPPFYQALLSMNYLRTLTLSDCRCLTHLHSCLATRHEFVGGCGLSQIGRNHYLRRDV
jgi:hypothetical protein